MIWDLDLTEIFIIFAKFCKKSQEQTPHNEYESDKTVIFVCFLFLGSTQHQIRSLICLMIHLKNI